MGNKHDRRFPGESSAYRSTRDELLDMEAELRRLQEAVAAKRRTLPLGGKVPEDYVFEAVPSEGGGNGGTVSLSQMFRPGQDNLVVYGFMYGPDWEQACPMCTSMLDSLNGTAPHVGDRISLAVVAKAPPEKIQAWARQRGWRNLRLFSSADNTFNRDYFAESPDGDQLPSLNVFARTAEGVFHFYNTELFFVPPEEGQHPRHVDLIWPVWNLFDLTPEGRGADWFPKVSYGD